MRTTARVTTPLGLLLALALAAPASAQQEPVREGDHVRSRGLRVEGEVQRIDGDVLVLRPVAGRLDNLMLPRADLRDLEVSRGTRRNTVQGILYGGGALGLTLALVSATSWEPCTSWCIMHPESAVEAAVWGGTAGLVAGGVLGGVIGALTKTTEWEAAQFQTVGFVLPAPGGRVAAGLRLSW